MFKEGVQRFTVTDDHHLDRQADHLFVGTKRQAQDAIAEEATRYAAYAPASNSLTLAGRSAHQTG